MDPRLGTLDQAIKIMLVDDQVIVRQGLRMLLESNDNFEVVAEASNCVEAVSSADRYKPDIILLDLDLGDDSGKDCLKAILKVSPHSRIVILTGTPNSESHYEAICLGAFGLVHKLEASDILIKAIKKVYNGEVWLDGQLMANILDEFWRIRGRHSEQSANNNPSNGNHEFAVQLPVEIPPEQAEKIALLTNREKEVIALIGEGLRNQQIADRLFISVITVRHHLSSVFSKLEVSDRFELAIYSFRYGLAKLPI